MKKWLPILLIAMLLLTGCAGNEPAMTISTAKLNEDETAIAKLLGADMDQHIYDYRADDELKSVRINAYELVDGKWENCIGGGAMAVSGGEGRFALAFDVLPDGLRTAFQHGEESSASTWTAPQKLDITGMSRSSVRLEELSSFEYEEEIALMAQIITRKNEIKSLSPDEVLSSPEKIAEYGYDHVYLVTVTFSKNPLE